MSVDVYGEIVTMPPFSNDTYAKCYACAEDDEALYAWKCPIVPMSACDNFLLLGLEVVEQNGALLRLLAPILHDDTGAIDDFACVALLIDLAYKASQ